ncbi:multidrug effflux MFS transporter [Burkholderia sp. FERM BP-3421]|uniref:multidrug effflux MFS transporter n=1 Tax=Burkholderia sp. FERM BP-3421 TaxID=1494466 RepID=UPI00236300F1|nr:multidrug effflux MFS transporter [Burkholderia sp. FERM BP-3421]WDD92648.1 multidrug effflux MFS transporter [Burkholderia sp. FERM BP-3421]
MNHRFYRVAVILGLISAIGPFAVDMYLPALPVIGRSLGADMGSVQLSLTAFFVSLGIGQLFYGPVSDMVGRKPPLYAGLALFVVASIGCALATRIETLVALRFVQGLGAAAGMVIPRAVVRDLHTGNDAARLMSLLMLVLSVSPILAPLVGSVVIAHTSWRGVFWAVTFAAVAGLALAAGMLAETRNADARVESSLGSVLRAYAQLLRDRHYLGLVFIGSFAFAIFFIYLANSPFVLIEHYGLSPTLYGIAFGVNAAAFFGAAQLNGPLCERFGIARVIRFSVLGCSVALLALLAHYLAGGDRLWVLLTLYFFASAFMGWMIPTTSVLALDTHGSIAGTASALLGTLQMMTGAVATGLMGLFSSDSPLPMVAGMTLSALLALVLTRFTLGGRAAARACAP